MRTRTSRLVRSIGSATAALALVFAGSASPAGAAAPLGDNPVFQEMTAALNATAALLTSNCRVDVYGVIDAGVGSDYIRTTTRFRTDGVSSHVDLKSYTSAGGSVYTLVNDFDEGLLSGQTFYSAGKYTSNMTLGSLKKIKVAALLKVLGGTTSDYYQSATVPEGMSSLKPSDYCINLKLKYADLVATVQNVAQLTDGIWYVMTEVDPVDPTRTNFTLVGTGDANTRITVKRDRDGIADFIEASAATDALYLKTSLTFVDFGDAVVVPPLPAVRVFTVAQMNTAGVRVVLDPKVKSYAVSVSKAVEKAAKAAKGAAKNKVTAGLIQSKATPLVPAKSGMKLKKITGGVKIYGTKSGVTSAFCVRASGSKALVASC